MRIIIADDHSLVADGFEKVITDNSAHEVITKTTDGKSLLQLLNGHKPDLILLDINMPHLSGVETAKIVKQRFPEIKILVVSMYHDRNIASQLKEIGVKGYLSKEADAVSLMEAISIIETGQTVFPFIKTNATQKEDTPELDFLKRFKLSQREWGIIELVAKGLSNKEIALATELSVLTVETHRKNIFRKLKVKSLVELTNWYHQQIKPSDR